MNGFPSLQHFLVSEIDVEPMRMIGDVAIINICRVIDGLIAANLHPAWGEPWKMSYEDRCALELAWCETHGAVLYEAPRESFSHWDAFELAVSQGRKAVVVSDLS